LTATRFQARFGCGVGGATLQQLAHSYLYFVFCINQCTPSNLEEVTISRSSCGKKAAIFGALIALFGSLALLNPAFPQDRGLHNSSKTFVEPAEISWEDWSDPRELQRSWHAAIVRIPINKGQSRLATVSDLIDETAGIDGPIPTAIYLHGCSGFWPGTHLRTKFLADNGFLVIAPASFARAKYPRSCNIKTKKGGLFRQTLNIRQYDAGHAIEMAKQLPIVDDENIVLVGFSEGALVAATFEAENERQQTSARIVEGWTCNTPWPEHKGVNAPSNEPVLTLVGERDPWYQDQWTRGDCTPFLNETNGSKSIVYRDELLAPKHGLLEFPSVQKDVLAFLKEHGLVETMKDAQ
jgi:dienelactone hydrolase